MTRARANGTGREAFGDVSRGFVYKVFGLWSAYRAGDCAEAETLVTHREALDYALGLDTRRPDRLD